MLYFQLVDYPKCTDKQFECKNFRCISKNLVCNGEDNCRDGNKTDEIQCRKSYSCPTINVRVEFPLCLMNTIVCVLFCSGSSL